jgi:hypothetical protein
VKYEPKISFARIDQPEPMSNAPSVLAFSVAKAGSTLLYNFLTRLAPLADLTYFSIENFLFDKNISATNRPGNIGNIFRKEGYCYGGFRQYPAFPVPILHSSKIVFLVRDPRDMITSLYFSLKYSHKFPDGGGEGARREMEKARMALANTEIDRFAVENIRNYVRMFEGYVAQGFAWRPNVATYRYEDVIFRKEEWLADICDWYGWNIDAAMRAEIIREFDRMPESEQPHDHIRQVKPGNYRQHLSPETEERIRSALSEYMRIFGYIE